MSTALAGLRFNIATLIQGFAPGTALQMLHDAALDACLEHEKYPDDLPAAQRAVVDGDLERTLGEIEAAAVEPAAKWNAAHPNEPQVWPTMIAGRGPGQSPCAFYSSGLMEFPEERTAWFDQAGLEGLGAVDPETLERAHRTVARGEGIIDALEVVRGPADWLLGKDAVDRMAGGVRAALGLPGGDTVPVPSGDCRDAPLGGLFACGLGERGPAIWGVAGAVGSLAVMGMLPVSLWVRLLGAVVGGAGAYAVMRRGAA